MQPRLQSDEHRGILVATPHAAAQISFTALFAEQSTNEGLHLRINRLRIEAEVIQLRTLGAFNGIPVWN
jgi:hypothetical protein